MGFHLHPEMLDADARVHFEFRSSTGLPDRRWLAV